MIVFGVAGDTADAFLSGQDTDPDVEVWPENWETVTVFDACATQWRWTSGMTVIRTGLDYAALGAVMNLLDIPTDRRAEIFGGVRIMEAQALLVWAKNDR